MKTTQLKSNDMGHIASMLGIDVGRFDQSLKFIPQIVIVPVQSLIYTYLLWNNLGMKTIAGLSVVYFMVPLQCKKSDYFI